MRGSKIAAAVRTYFDIARQLPVNELAQKSFVVLKIFQCFAIDPCECMFFCMCRGEGGGQYVFVC